MPIKVAVLGSGNTVGARWWSDGMMLAPMMPDNPWLRRNPETGETFWMDECEEIASEEPFGGPSSYPHAPFAAAATEDDLRARLQDEDLSAERERYLRTRLWWKANDAARHEEADDGRPADFEENLRRLLEVLGAEDDEARLMSAEILRQLGERARAEELLRDGFDESLQPAADVIRAANEKGEIQLRELC